MKIIKAYLLGLIVFAVEICAESKLYVSPTFEKDGAPSCSYASPCGIQQAVNRSRLELENNADVTIVFKEGTYELDSTVIIEINTPQNYTGTLSFVSDSDAHPILSGGRRIVDWVIHDSTRNIWKAKVPANIMSRQFFVNGKRAVRARSNMNFSSYAKTVTGYLASDDYLNAIQKPELLEIVSFVYWKGYRCPVSSITGRNIFVAKECWDSSNAHTGFEMGKIQWIENAYEFLDSPGEWFLDPIEGFVFYKPQTNEDIQNSTAILPTTETLFRIKGNETAAISNVQFKGLTFAYTTWLRPNSKYGFPDLQGSYVYGDSGYGGEKISSGLEVWYGHNISFIENHFELLGGNGPAIEEGCKGIRFIANTFTDISGNGLHIGNINSIVSDKQKVDGVLIENNYVTKTGQEYQSTAGIFVAYAKNVKILHNQVHDMPHIGISVGWGWGRPSYMENNEIAYNLIYDHMNLMDDGGGIYTLGDQPGSTIHHNYIFNQLNRYGAIYLDEGSSHIRIEYNVLEKVPMWLNLWHPADQYDTAMHNYSDINLANISGTNCMVDSNTYVESGVWPENAIQIMSNAGILSEYQHIKTVGVTGKKPRLAEVRRIKKNMNRNHFYLKHAGKLYLIDGKNTDRPENRARGGI